MEGESGGSYGPVWDSSRSLGGVALEEAGFVLVGKMRWIGVVGIVRIYRAVARKAMGHVIRGCLVATPRQECE
jgi:hypothetical protein